MSIGFGKEHQQGWSNTITKMWWPVKQFDGGGAAFSLNIATEGSQYENWYRGGNSDGITWNEDHTIVLTAPDGWLKSYSEAAHVLNSLIDACDKANVKYNDNDLSSFVGLNVEWTDVPSPYKSKDVVRRTMRVAKSVTGTDPFTRTDPAPLVDDTVRLEVLSTAINHYGGSVDINTLDAKSIKQFTNGLDYAARKELVESLSVFADESPSFTGDSTAIRLA